MKLYLTLFAIIFLGFNSAFSQNNNLQFNNALLGQVSGTPDSGVIGTLVVPEGKVWKIESRSVANISYSKPDASSGGVTAFIGNLIAYGSSDTFNNNSLSFPIWLPSGSYPITIRSNYSGGYIHSFNYSGIEFNLVP